ncbi:MAG: DNA polymerase III subunit delta [Planctomycetes bacterium]|nr:DNA polymerase III subunit delta [Planctomycetota bacterium]
MNYLEFIRKLRGHSSVEINSLKKHRIFVLSGPEDFLKERALEQIRSLHPEIIGRLKIFRSDDFIGADFLNELYSVSFFQEKKLVLLKLLPGQSGRSEIISVLEKYLSAPSLFVGLIIMVDRWPKNSAVARLAAEKGLTVDCYKIPEYELARWVVAECRARKKRLSFRHAQLIVDRIENDLNKLDALIRNLVLFVGSREEINSADIDKFVEPDRRYETKQLARAITRRQTSESLKIIRRLLTKGESINMIIGYLTWYFKSESTPELKSKLKNLLEADLAIKTGLMDEELAAEMLVLKLI